MGTREPRLAQPPTSSCKHSSALVRWQALRTKGVDRHTAMQTPGGLGSLAAEPMP